MKIGKTTISEKHYHNFEMNDNGIGTTKEVIGENNIEHTHLIIDSIILFVPV